MKKYGCNQPTVCGIDDDFRNACIECRAGTAYINGSCLTGESFYKKSFILLDYTM